LPVGPEEKPDYVIRSIADVRKLPFTWGDAKISPQKHRDTEKTE
jgi:hypothetical protein